MYLDVLLEPKLDLPRLARVLSELGTPGRIDTTRRWSKKTLAMLWEASANTLPITVEDFVPADVAAMTEVIHHGTNSLVPGFTHFQKRFCKALPTSDGASPAVVGYNHQTWTWATGPGYFVVHAGANPGEVELDYRSLPVDKPPSWPAIAPNATGVGRLVYGGMVDVMRGLASHVTLGRAKREDRWLDQWFVLCREDTAPLRA